MNVLELSCQCVKELNKVLSFGMIFLEQMILVVIVVKAVPISLLRIAFHHIDDLLNLRHVKLLVEGVKSGTSLSPVLGHTLGRCGLVGLSVLSINGLFNNQSPLFL